MRQGLGGQGIQRKAGRERDIKREGERGVCVLLRAI